VAHTVVVGSSTQITGRKADILLAAHYASEAALSLMKPGTEVRRKSFLFTKKKICKFSV
jgi:hypothetical protein